MRQNVNFSSVFIKQLDSNEFENKSKINFINKKNVFIIEYI